MAYIVMAYIVVAQPDRILMFGGINESGYIVMALYSHGLCSYGLNSYGPTWLWPIPDRMMLFGGINE